MKVAVFPDSSRANTAAANQLAVALTDARTRNVLIASGNTPLQLYREISLQHLKLGHLHVFALDEYVGVPLDEPRNCANLIRRTLVDPWKIPPAQFHFVSSQKADAQSSIEEHERLIDEQGGIDIAILGLGQNGHLAFNEPGSLPDSTGRLVTLQPISVEANRQWFKGDYAPSIGVTVGLKTILAAAQIVVLAYGPHKAAAVHAMVHGPVTVDCPASHLQHHGKAHIFLDEPAAARLESDGDEDADQGQ